MAYRIFRGREGLWLCYRIALRALPEGYNIGTMRIGSPRVIPKEKLCQPWLRCLFGCNLVVCGEVSLYDLIAYELGKYEFAGLQRIFTGCCLTTDCSRNSGRVVAVKLRHDAHL
ncbi:hypothetical protein EVAR_70114_1 [Eumeta japonica]|uniref:Uncharacterized protein n=1 Tax=Eumeta variegata TaxID=151549 RepID=A0A4C1SBG9_EUMVA|nr:hypothetical protein EVAR_70114_1 [Eumeta japonica]